MRYAAPEHNIASVELSPKGEPNRSSVYFLDRQTKRSVRHCACTGFAFRFEHRKWNRGRNGLPQLGQPFAPSILFPVFKSVGEPGTDPEVSKMVARGHNTHLILMSVPHVHFHCVRVLVHSKRPPGPPRSTRHLYSRLPCDALFFCLTGLRRYPPVPRRRARGALFLPILLGMEHNKAS